MAVPTFRPNGVGLAFGRVTELGAKTLQKALYENSIHLYCISNHVEVTGVVHTVEAIATFARDHEPGRYVVIEHYPDVLHDSIALSRAWGEAIHHLDGKVAIRIAPSADSPPAGERNYHVRGQVRRSAELTPEGPTGFAGRVLSTSHTASEGEAHCGAGPLSTASSFRKSRSSFASIARSRASSSGEIDEAGPVLMVTCVGWPAVGVGSISTLGRGFNGRCTRFGCEDQSITSPPEGVISCFQRTSFPLGT
jgi:hypothetical protein